MRVLVTGSRDWDDAVTVTDVLRQIHLRPGPHTLVSGACPRGADALAETVAHVLGWTVERHPADWSKGKGAGLARNREMAALGADGAVAFNRNNSRGTQHMVNQCIKHGIPVTEYIYMPRDRRPAPQPRKFVHGG